MKDEKHVDARGADTQRSSEVPFLKHLQSETDRRREFSDAFAREPTEPLTMAGLRESHQRQATQLAKLSRTVGRLRRSVLIANLCSGVVIVTLVALAVFLYQHADQVFDKGSVAAGPTDAARRHTRQGNEGGASNLTYLVDEFTIQNDVDRKYQLIVRELYQVAGTMRPPNRSDSLELRNVDVERYVQFMADISQVIEHAAEDAPSPEIMLAIVNVATIGREFKDWDRAGTMNPQMQDRVYQIGAVMRARDVRSQRSDRLLSR